MKAIENNIITVHQYNDKFIIHFLEIAPNYEDALRIAKTKATCRKFHNKSYGGGIAFYSLQTIKQITNCDNINIKNLI